MPTFDAGEFHAGKRATLTLMFGLFAFGSVSGWSGREMFDALRSPPQTAQVGQVSVAQPREDQRAASPQQPQKNAAPQSVPSVSSEEYRTIEPLVAVLPATPIVKDVDESDEHSPRLFDEMPKLGPEVLRRKPGESWKECWRRFWFLDQPEHASPLRTYGGII